MNTPKVNFEISHIEDQHFSKKYQFLYNIYLVVLELVRNEKENDNVQIFIKNF